MFIPLEMRESLRDITVVGPDGNEQPLVVSERVVFESSTSYGRNTPPKWLLAFLGTGLLLAVTIALPVAFAMKSSARVVATVPAVLWVLALGIAGVTMAGLWTLTNHWIAYRNENLLLFNPVALFLVVTVPLLARGHAWAARASVVLAGATVGLSLVGFLVQVLPWFDQVNGSMIALALPPNLAVGWVVWRLATQSRSYASPQTPTTTP
jgi:hypothetical protein